MKHKGKISVFNLMMIVLLIVCFAIGGLVIVLSMFKNERNLIGATIDEIDKSYTSTESTTNEWDVSKNRDGSVMATLAEDGTLTISGSGEMKDWMYTETDWYGVKEKIKKVVVENGVTSIGKYAFNNCSSLTNINIPSSVTYIGDDAFSSCTSLTNINIPSSVTYIGRYAFSRCSTLTSIELPSNITSIGYRVFSNCSNLTNIELPSSVTSIGDYAFYECSNLSNIKLPSSVISIGGWAFFGCSSLTNINIPSSVASIGISAFSSCTSLKSLEIKGTSISLGKNAFYNCKFDKFKVLDNITITGEDSFYECTISNFTNSKDNSIENLLNIVKRTMNPNDILYSSDGVEMIKGGLESDKIIFDENGMLELKIKSGKLKCLRYIFAYTIWDVSNNENGSIIATLTEEGTLTISGSGKMKNWQYNDTTDWHGMKESVKSVIIENGVTNIGEYAFSECESLISVTIPDSVTSIEKRAFSQCDNLANVEISSNVTNIGEYAFGYCRSLTGIEIPNSVKSIGMGAFYECTTLTSINIPKSVTNIEFGTAFEGCSSLINIEVDPDNSNYMDDNGVLYKKGSNLELIQYPIGKKDTEYSILEGCTDIGGFFGCEYITSIKMPNTVKIIHNSAFAKCNNLTNINIPNGVTHIYASAFEKCSSLTNIELPNTILEMGNSVFSGCSSLTNIKLPEKETSIERYLFEDCISLISIEIPQNVTNIYENVFLGCTSLESIKVNEKNTNYMDDNGVLYKKGSNLEIIKYPEGKKDTEYNILERCTKISSLAFYNSTKLTSITIPRNVTTIGSSAFWKCSSLMNVEIQGSAITIESASFSECKIYNLKVSENIEIKGEDAFYKCTIVNRTNSEINSTEKLNVMVRRALNENDTLYSTDGVEIVKGSLEDDKIILNENGKLELEVKSGILEGLKCILVYTEWDVSKNGDESVIATLIEEGTLTISGSGKMKDWQYNDTTDWHEIKKMVKNVSLENGVTNIGQCAFWDCTSLTGIVIPNSVTNIGKDAFGKCTNLTIICAPNSRAATYAEENEINYIIDELAPEAEVNYSITEPTKQNVTVTITANEVIQEVEDWELLSTGKEVTKEYTENTAEEGENVIIKDVFGNETIVNVTVLNIDNKGPKVTFTQNGTTKPEKQITTTVNITDDKSGVNETSLTYLWSAEKENITKEEIINELQNGQELELKDMNGTYYLWIYAIDNMENETIQVSNPFELDNSAPEATITYSTEELTNRNVIVTITADEVMQQVEDWDLSSTGKELTKEYTTNTSQEGENVIIKDLAGNEKIVKVTVLNIDKTAPEPTVIYSTEDLTNQNVIVTITTNEVIQPMGGWDLSSTGKELTKEYTTNTPVNGENIIIKDLVGNEKNVNIKVLNIDKTAPEPTITYSTEAPTNQSVIVTITANEVIQPVEGWDLSSTGKVLTKEYTANTPKDGENVIIKDLVENETTVNVNVLNIDKIAPDTVETYSTVNLTNQNVLVTIKASEVIQQVAGWDLSSDGKELTKEYAANTAEEGENITIKDLAGNEKIVNITVLNIDKTSPEVTVIYSTEAPTNQNVVVTIKTNEKIQHAEGWGLSSSQEELIKEYTTNTSKDGENIIVKDLVGNETIVNVKVLNIDKKAPTLTLSYETTANTIKVKANASDAESGIAYQSYIYSIREENGVYGTAIAGDSSYIFTNVIKNKKYIIKVEVFDNAGNKISKEIETIIKLSDKITSTEYKVDEEAKIITKIKPKTSVQNLSLKLQNEMSYEIINQRGEKVTNTSYVGTGYKIKLAENKVYTIIIWGDVSGDGQIKVSDLARVSRIARENTEMTELEKLATDINGDGKISVSDLAVISRFARE